MRFDPAASDRLNPSETTSDNLENKSYSFNGLSAGPIAVPFPLSWSRTEFAVLSAWTVLLKGYYGQDPVSFLSMGRAQTSSFSSEAMKSESISVELQSEWCALDLQRVLSQCTDSTEANHAITDGSHCSAVWFANEADECPHEVGDLEKASKVTLLLVAKRMEQDGVELNLYSHRKRPCAFEISSLLDSFRKILESIVYYPSRKAKDIEVLSNYDRFRLRAWMEVEPPKPATTVHGLVDRHYQERPDRVAVSSTSGDVTYEELGKRSAAMARKLIDYGVRQGDVVGFCVEKSALSLIVLLAILRAGAGYVPIATCHPVDRMAYITRKAGIPFLVAECAVIERLKDHNSFHGVQMIDPSLLDKEKSFSDGWARELDASPSQVAYIMFTSGSTGQPKGVVHRHGAVSGGLEAVSQSFGLETSTRFLQFASFSFDASICELFAPWVVGGTVCIPSEEERIEDLEGVMHRLNVTDASLTPAIVTSLRPEALPTLRNLYIGGEAPTPLILTTWADKVRLSNIYGLTEGGAWDAVELKMGPNDNPKTIGRGIGAKCWIVDPDNLHRLQPIGVEGEVLLQSPYLAHGFVEDTAQNDNAFISLPDSLSTLTGPFLARCYRTGDLARWQHDGKMIFCGRRVGFVKIRGLRVELGEIEKGICDFLPGGERAAVIMAGGENASSSELVAFIEQNHEQPSSLADRISMGLRKTIPSYMIPSAFVPLRSMPLTDSKKIDRQRLAADWARMTSSEKMVLRPGGTRNESWSQIDPTNLRAMELSNIVADLVEKSHSAGKGLRGWDFPLTSVGLDSIQTVYLSREIRRCLGGAIRAQDLQQPGLTVCQIEQQLSERASGRSDGCSGVIIPRDLLGELSSTNIPEPIHTERTKTIFATSVTGFLGSQVLRGLLDHPAVARIVGLVRADNEEEALNKIRDHAKLGQWWRAEFESRIEVWLGDLTLPRLGLDDSHWMDLRGRMRIDGLIHNGARVNWLDDFSTLKPANVDSTHVILQALSEMPTLCPFTYVCGGYLPAPSETREQVLNNLADACGYDQTKFLSRMMIEKYNEQLGQEPKQSVPRGRVVQPGFLAGTRWEGIAHPDDFLWRLAYTILSIGSVSRDLKPGHIPVTGVEQMASIVVKTVLNPQGEQAVDCHDGVSIETFCSILSNRSGRPVTTMDHGEWMKALRADIESSSLDHRFLPVLDWFESNMEQFMHPPPAGLPTVFNERDTVAALEKSTDYLVDIGFLPSEDGHCRPGDQHDILRFRRSSR